MVLVSDLQISDFNNKFNTNLDSDDLISIYNAGMAVMVQLED